jgi:hypothetical protein
MGLLFSLNLIHKVYINNADIELLCAIKQNNSAERKKIILKQ